MRERSWRRAQRALAVERARDRARRIGVSADHMEAWVGRSAVTPHPCSGHCCGNPRAHGGGGRVGEYWPRVDDVWE